MMTLQLVALLGVIGHGFAARMLAVLPFPGNSHHLFHFTVLRALAERGHEVVEYSPFPPPKPIANYTHVMIKSSFGEEFKKIDYEGFKRACAEDQPSVFEAGFEGVWAFTLPTCEETFKHKAIQKLLSSREHFDLVFTESSFGQESLVMFGHKFKTPVISLQTFYMWSVVNRDAGNTLSIANIPQFNSLVATNRMSFLERLLNFIAVTVSLYSYYNHYLPRHEKLIRENYNESIPPLQKMLSAIPLYLIYTHPAIDYPQPYPPNVIPVGGISISSDRLPLPKNIKKFMDEASDGVIYFSMGTVVPMHIMPPEILKIFVSVFKKIQQRVIWKIDLDHVEGLPQNVLLVKWVPQPGVLSHPNCLLFLTHGGLNSQQEAIHAGVPTVGIPFFGDQFYNIRIIEHHGVGVKLEFNSLSEQTLSAALDTVIGNTRYKENAVRLSKIYRDHPMPLIDTAVFWIEYVLRHGGASHLRPAAANMPWYQLALLDVIGTVVATFVTVVIILYFVMKRLFLLIRPKITQEKLLKKKKK